ncbi:MAG TPA: purine-nucleoside phosphorylase [Fibrobacteraceae bacterium]|nr:purine-nucleoside phosphorylase [Fibrobacteraceae bacterium]
MAQEQTLQSKLDEACAFIRTRLPDLSTPWFGLVLGTGLGGLVERMTHRQVIPYAEIPHFPESSVPSHAGELVHGHLAGKEVLILRGRSHVYEGLDPAQIVFPVRVLCSLGVQILLLTNAAGGLNPLFAPGDVMAATDFINLTGRNPLMGSNLDSLGPRFPDMTQVYDRELLQLAQDAALEERIHLQRGVYVGVVGPSMETPAETRMLRIIGADAVGMSTIPEVIAAVHCGLRILQISAITNVNRPDCMEPAPLDTIIANAEAAGAKIGRILEEVLQLLPEGL